DGGGGGALNLRGKVGGVVGAAAGEVAQRAAGNDDVGDVEIGRGFTQLEGQVRHIMDFQEAVIGTDRYGRRYRVDRQRHRVRGQRRIAGIVGCSRGEAVRAFSQHPGGKAPIARTV